MTELEKIFHKNSKSFFDDETRLMTLIEFKSAVLEFLESVKKKQDNIELILKDIGKF